MADFEGVVTELTAPLLRLATLLTGGDRHAADDLVQEALLRTFTRWRRVKSADDRLAYVRRMLVNVHLDEKRRRTVSTVPLDFATGIGSRCDVAQLVIDRGDLWDRVKRLPDRQRTVLVLRFYEDLDAAEVGDLMQISPSSVRSATARALDSLRDQSTTASPKGSPS